MVCSKSPALRAAPHSYLQLTQRVTPLQGCQPASAEVAEDSLCNCIWPVFLLLAVQLSSCACLQSNSLLDKIKAAVEDNSAPLARQGALAVLTAVASNGGRVAEPYVVPLLDLVLERYADKVMVMGWTLHLHAHAYVPCLGLTLPFIVCRKSPSMLCTTWWHRLWGLPFIWAIPLELAACVSAFQLWACLPCCRLPAFRHTCLYACLGKAVLLDKLGHGAAACCPPFC